MSERGRDEQAELSTRISKHVWRIQLVQLIYCNLIRGNKFHQEIGGALGKYPRLLGLRHQAHHFMHADEKHTDFAPIRVYSVELKTFPEKRRFQMLSV